MEITFNEAVEYLQEGEEITLECEGYSYEISSSADYVGGDVAEGFISSVLGNVIYNNAEHIIKKSIDFLLEEGKEVKLSI